MSHAYAQHFYTRKYTVNDGLPDSYILGLFQDSQGFLWIGTASGLSRFDGKEFVNYGFESGLPDLRVDVIYEDHQHRLWLGSRRGIVELRGGKCINWPLNDGLRVSFVFRIIEGPDGKLLACTDKGVYTFDGACWKKVQLAAGMADMHCRDIVSTSKGCYYNYGNKLLFRTQQGVWQVRGTYGEDVPFFNHIQSCKDSLYLSLPHALVRLTFNGWPEVFATALHDKKIGPFFKDSRERFWINTDIGLLISKPGSFSEITDTIVIPFHLVSNIFEDREGNIWIAAYDGLWQIRDVSFAVVRDGLQSPIHNMIRTRDNRILITTQQGLQELAGDRFVASRLLDPAAHCMALAPFAPARRQVAKRHAAADLAALAPLFQKDVPDDYCIDSKGHILLMMRDHGVYVLDGTTIRKPPAAYTDHNGINRSIDYDRKQERAWLCADSVLLCGNSEGFQIFYEPQTHRIITNPRSVKCLANGNVLVWTADNHFYLIDKDSRVHDVSMEVDIRQKNQRVHFLTVDSASCWIVYNGGMSLYRWDSAGMPHKELQLLSTGIVPINTASNLVLDRWQRCWTITNTGIAVIETRMVAGVTSAVGGTPAAGLPPDARPAIAPAYNVHRAAVNLLGRDAGLISDQWAHVRLLTDSAGLIFVAFPDRIIRIDPAQVRFDHHAPAAAIEDVQLTRPQASWYPSPDSIYGYRRLPRKINLPYDGNSLSISYRTPSFDASSDIEYDYQLKGAQEEGWSIAAKNNFVTFVQLPPGEYRFAVRGRMPDSEWGSPAELSFTIAKPYWQTWWFRLSIALLCLSVATGFFFYRIRQVNRKARLAGQVRELELKALRAQMNPHFIYNALNSIQALVLDNKTEMATLYISKFSRVLRQVLNHSEHSLIPLKEELAALELYLQLEELRLHVNLRYSIDIAPELDPSCERIPPLILQPYVENALWHGLSRKKGDKVLQIKLSLSGTWLVVEIIDNGIGRAQAALLSTAEPGKTSRGMEITGRRISEHNQAHGASPAPFAATRADGQSAADSRTSGRSAASAPNPPVEVTDLYNNSDAAGTKVTVWIGRANQSEG